MHTEISLVINKMCSSLHDPLENLLFLRLLLAVCYNLRFFFNRWTTNWQLLIPQWKQLHYTLSTLFAILLPCHGDRSFPQGQNLWLSFLLSPKKCHQHVFPSGCSTHHDVALIVLKPFPISKIRTKHSVPVELSKHSRSM